MAYQMAYQTGSGKGLPPPFRADEFSQILIIYVKIHQIHVANFQGRHFLTKKKPAGMPTHRTGLDNIKNPLKSIKVN